MLPMSEQFELRSQKTDDRAGSMTSASCAPFRRPSADVILPEPATRRSLVLNPDCKSVQSVALARQGGKTTIRYGSIDFETQYLGLEQSVDK